VQYRTVGTTPKPFWEAIKEFPTACGDVGWAAVHNIVQLLGHFRERGWPVLYPYVSPKQSFDHGRLSDKVPAIMTVAAKGYEFVAEVAPREKDILLPKKHPSAFFGTPLATYLIEAGADTLVVGAGEVAPAAPPAAASAAAWSTPSPITSACWCLKTPFMIAPRPRMRSISSTWHRNMPT